MLYYNSVWILLRLFYAKQNAPIDFSRALKHAWIKHRSVLLFFFFVRKKFVSHVRIEEKQEKKRLWEICGSEDIVFPSSVLFFVTPPKNTQKINKTPPQTKPPPKDQKINTPQAPKHQAPPTKDPKNQQKRQKKTSSPPQTPPKNTNKQTNQS